MSELHENPAPTVPLLCAGALVLITLLGVAWQRLVVDPSAPAAAATSAIVSSQVLKFADLPDGSVEVISSADDRVLDVIAPGEGGFVRGTLRGLIRERRTSNLPMTPGFRLEEYADGTVVLIDLASQRRIDLRAFGSINAKDFLRYLPSYQPAVDDTLHAASMSNEGD
ncbi:MAG: photosynthetic complex assembly protein PuhC [Pseudomonadota bacterium]